MNCPSCDRSISCPWCDGSRDLERRIRQGSYKLQAACEAALSFNEGTHTGVTAEHVNKLLRDAIAEATGGSDAGDLLGEALDACEAMVEAMGVVVPNVITRAAQRFGEAVLAKAKGEKP